MKIKTDRAKNYLNGEALFKAYWEMNTAKSFKRLAVWAAEHGMTSPVTGKVPNKMSMYKSMYRWATRKENFDKSFEIVAPIFRDNAQFITKSEWKEFLKERAKSAWQHNSQKNYERFLRQHGYEV
jgi:hypothetical protein